MFIDQFDEPTLRVRGTYRQKLPSSVYHSSVNIGDFTVTLNILTEVFLQLFVAELPDQSLHNGTI